MWNGLAVVASLAVGSASVTTGEGCNTYPPEVLAGYSDCILRDVGERPLWGGALPRGVRQEMRFTFTHGHLAETRIIHVTRHANGRASIRALTLRRNGDGMMARVATRRRKLSAQQVAMIDTLGAASGTWEHRIGSWDGGELFMHCETLDMECATPMGYSYSSVSIGCNKPEKLMPFVNFVTQLAGLTS